MKNSIERFKQERLKAFEKKFVVSAGTKRIKRVGHYVTPTSDVPTAAYWDDVKAFFGETIDLAFRQTAKELISLLIDYSKGRYIVDKELEVCKKV